MTVRWVLCGPAFLVLACACETTRITPHRGRTDAGSDVSVGEGGRGTGGAPTVHPKTGGSSSRDAAPTRDVQSGAVCREALASISDGALSGPGCDGGASKSPDDGGYPPPECVPPCLWDLMKNCRPKGRCISQEYPLGVPDAVVSQIPPVPFARTVSCAPDNDWWHIFSGALLTTPGNTEDFYSGECLCYRVSKQAYGSLLFGASHFTVEWTDASGRLVAEGDFYENSVICGPYERHHSPDDAYLHDDAGKAVGVLPGFTKYIVHPDDPACAQWRLPNCEPGCCPGNPPKLPHEFGFHR